MTENNGENQKMAYQPAGEMSMTTVANRLLALINEAAIGG